MLRKSSFLILIFVWCWLGNGSETSTASSLADIDQYISERRPPNLEQKLDDLEPKVTAASAYLAEQLAKFSEFMGRLRERANEINESKPVPNLYKDPAWKTEALKQAVKTCCEIKADPNLQKAIKKRVAAGQPPL